MNDISENAVTPTRWRPTSSEKEREIAKKERVGATAAR
jgi:hypothetical protein